MGHRPFSETEYESAVRSRAPMGSSHVTRRAEQAAQETGKMNPLVDPAEFGVIRRSLPRFELIEKLALWRMTIGLPMPVETRVDTTGSMGGNVDVALRVLPKAYKLCSLVLPGFDVQMATGIFGDVSDRFVLCRPQFEMTAEKLVEQLTLMVPCRQGGDTPEDPHYGLFGAAYLTDARIEKYGLKGYDFTVSDAPARDTLSEGQLKRIYGPTVFEKVLENGFQLNKRDLPSTKDVVKDLLKRAHAFFLQVGNDSSSETGRFWSDVFGENRVVLLPDTELIPQVQAVIIGLTEGMLSLSDAKIFLVENGVNQTDAGRIMRSVSNIPIGIQAAIRAKLDNPLPKKDDLFKEKTDLWPVDPVEIEPIDTSGTKSASGPTWL